MKNRAHIDNLIFSIIEEINAEDKRQKEGESVESTSQQREYIMREMQELREDDEAISKKKYSDSFAMAFKCWEWDMQAATKLYILLVKLNDALKE